MAYKNSEDQAAYMKEHYKRNKDKYKAKSRKRNKEQRKRNKDLLLLLSLYLAVLTAEKITL